MTDRAPDRPPAAGRHRRWLPAALWAVGLLTVSSWPNPDPPDVRGGDKALHGAMYAGLTFLVARAAPGVVGSLRGAGALVVGGSAFGAVDEWHQRFIPGRSSSRDDWVADTLGAALGVLGARARRRAQPA